MCFMFQYSQLWVSNNPSTLQMNDNKINVSVHCAETPRQGDIAGNKENALKTITVYANEN